MSEKNFVPPQITQVAATTLNALVSPTADSGMVATVQELLRLVDSRLPDSPARACLHAGLWLLADDLDKAHGICQEIPTAHGSAWHAVVHRIEGDFWNSKYWWRRAAGVGWEGLTDRAKREIATLPPEMKFLTSPRYDPGAFVDLVEAHHKSPPQELRHAMITLQRLEWLTLFEHCWIETSR